MVSNNPATEKTTLTKYGAAAIAIHNDHEEDREEDNPSSFASSFLSSWLKKKNPKGLGLITGACFVAVAAMGMLFSGDHGEMLVANTSTSISSGEVLEPERFQEAPKVEAIFSPVSVGKGICCCDGESCDEATQCNCPEVGGESTAKFYARPNDKPGTGICSLKGYSWWTTSAKCYVGVTIPSNALGPPPASEVGALGWGDGDHCTHGRCESFGNIISGPCCPCYYCHFNYGSKYKICRRECGGPGCECEPACFSQKSSVNVAGKGVLPIHKVKIGDFVQSTSNGIFSRVWGFDMVHDKEAQFHQIHTRSGNVLEITARHMVFLSGTIQPIPAHQVKVGDILMTTARASSGLAGEVVKVNVIHRDGFYNPLTENGSIVVDGTVASTFSIAQGTSSPFYDRTRLVHWHILSQIATAPVRFTCKAVWFGFCLNEEFQNENGLHTFVVLLKSASALPDWQQLFVFPLVFGLGLLCSILEWIYDSFYYSPTILTGTVFAVPLGIYMVRKRPHGAYLH